MADNNVNTAKITRNAKDAAEKALEAKNDVFADIMNVLLFNGEQEVTENALEQAPPRSIYEADGDLREQERDVTKYWKKINVRIALLGVENQTKQDADMPLRVIGYDGAAYRNQIKYVKGKDGKRRLSNDSRYPVVTVVLYFGTERWNKPLTLHGALEEIPEGLKPYVNDYRVHLFEVAWLTDEQVAMFRSDFRVVADYFVQKRKNKDYVPGKQQIIHVQEVMHLMTALTKDNRFEEAYNASVREGSEKRYMSEIMLDRIENRGLEKKLITQVRKKMQKNQSIREISEALEEQEENIRRIYDTITRLGLDASDENVYDELHSQDAVNS